MNIIVHTFSGRTVFRPDTTLEPFNRDYYPPEFVNTILGVPVIYVRISRPGKSIGEKFSQRYYDSFGRGILLYPADLLDGSEEGYSSACCLDHTSVLPLPGRETEEMSAAERSAVSKALSEVTLCALVRTGDVVAVELGERTVLGRRSEGEFEVKTGDAGFRVIF